MTLSAQLHAIRDDLGLSKAVRLMREIEIAHPACTFHRITYARWSIETARQYLDAAIADVESWERSVAETKEATK